MQSSYSDYSWSFLVAAPSFSGAFFEESVVLLLEDGEDGSFGVIINKSEGKTLGDINPDFAGTPLENVEVFDGGPIAKDRVSLAICYDDGKEDGAFSFGITPENRRVFGVFGVGREPTQSRNSRGNLDCLECRR